MSGRVLILDDDDAVGTTLALIARRAGYECAVTTEAAPFFEKAREWEPTHIVLDLVMPGLDGIEVLRELSSQACAADVILISGATGRVLEAAVRLASERGLHVSGLLQKPFSPTEFGALLGRHQAAGLAIETDAPGISEITERDLRVSLRSSALDVAYQPLIHCSDGRVAGFEALARWPAANGRRAVSPAEFIPLAERTGLIRELTDQIIAKALHSFVSEELCRGCHLALNLSPSLMNDIGLTDRLASAVRAAGAKPGDVTFEITETGAMAEPRTTLDVATRLRLKGFALAIDDFGVGNSSLVQLARLPFSTIKIDATFVTSIPYSEESRKIVRGLVALGHSLGLSVTAEGVENQEILDFLATVGCDLAQGLFISPPLAADALQQWLRMPRTRV